MTEQTIAEKYGFKTKIEAHIQKRLFDTLITQFLTMFLMMKRDRI